MAYVIDNPGDYLLEHNLAEEKLQIVDIEEVPVDSQDVWNKVTRSCVPDDHFENHYLRFRYTYAERPNGLLMIQQDGQVSVNGGLCQEDTLFKVMQNFSENSYQIIAIHGKNQNKILYMDGLNLKTREFKHGFDDNRPDTQFDFDVKGDNSWKIKSKETGHVLQFDTETGLYLPPGDQVDSPPLFCNPDIGPRFTAFIPTQMKVTTV
ncbi:uncharacterized protein LOC110451554 [Mizuhopecten yessoensis]|uniref:uncharacterized protein LOC110451554 n=1 Tax=Mizuhopecten yessoensis TaxID=6573 RepID=UPI000B45E638|nr:uncharacterized protein LOC110451554 [Mizuhopecten yessoensis]XP_021355327.1 uncharacterized protein LOC110451554 [Mizuhopecten yessoensis]XP_021355335.1 uncharacterized protein LOC110451554 [Mizuhopecten yessoensis]